MASWMAPYVECLEREVKWMDDYSEYLASKRLWAENKLQTEKLKTGKELSLKMLLVETKRAQKYYHREAEAKRVEYLNNLFHTVTRRHPRRRQTELRYILDWAELEARPDTAFLAVTVGVGPPWVGLCGTRSSMPEADIPVAIPLEIAPGIFAPGARTTVFPTGDEAIVEWEAGLEYHGWLGLLPYEKGKVPFPPFFVSPPLP